MTARTEGLHHVTAIAGDPQRNIDFYIKGLGLRLVKKTVNFDDPGTYHLYYGDESGRPGSLLTFFPWQGVRSGRVGNGQSTTTAFSVPQGTLGWWQEHFRAIGVESTITSASSEEDRLSLRDPDGLQIDLVASSVSDPRNPWDSASVPAEYAIRGQHSSVLTVQDPTRTLETFTRDLGMTVLAEKGGRFRLSTHGGEPGSIVDVVTDARGERGLVAGGTVHHVAFRVPDQQTQDVWRQELAERGYAVTAILDRQYFTSIYFREPGGTLLEIATDTPGFDIDEPLLELGRSLKLPPWLEPDREAISHAVAKIELPRENNPAIQAFLK
ncbi:ring-cleaving dioxygenase [Arthrobacter sp. B1805]|uniref:ring-cleaving dioxygenase n=1 Tax=Arthrobacter sp. B1805 TaxID=2058892 RepID=UPI000CE3C48B|nr:ring-cleaving dioxygenase [Arthrobacter sp. B1805]